MGLVRCPKCGNEYEAALGTSAMLCPSCQVSAEVVGGSQAEGDPLHELLNQTGPPTGQSPPSPAPPFRGQTRTTGAAKGSLVLGLISTIVPILMCVLPGAFLPCVAMVVEVVCAATGGILSVAALSTSYQSRQGKRMAKLGMFLCLAPMLTTILLVYGPRLGFRL